MRTLPAAAMALVVSLTPAASLAATPAPPETGGPVEEAPPFEPPARTERRWDGRFFDLPVDAAAKAPIDPILEERLTSPWIEERAEQRRFAAMTVGSGAALFGLAAVIFAGSFAVDNEADASTLRWTGGIGGGLGLAIFGAGLLSYFTLPEPPAYVGN